MGCRAACRGSTGGATGGATGGRGRSKILQGRGRGRSASDTYKSAKVADWLAQVVRQASNHIHCSMDRGPGPGD